MSAVNNGNAIILSEAYTSNIFSNSGESSCILNLSNGNFPVSVLANKFLSFLSFLNYNKVLNSFGVSIFANNPLNTVE